MSAGGDAGRDFETFRTSLNSPIVANSEFARLSSGSRDIACACSLQEKVTPKIKTDVRAIVAGEPCDEILYFCEEDIPIGKRNALKKWAQKGHKVELRIFDGTAISELLVDRETFWIAEEYLHLPSDLSDALIDTDSEFETLHKRWSNRIPLLHSQADFFEIKRALRHATFHVETRPRLGFWLAKMALFAVETSPLALRRRAQYEVAVATFRGRGEMTTQLPAMREYYHDFQVRGDAADLQDAATLCVYAFGAWSFGQLDVEPAELLVWRSSIATFLDDQIAHANSLDNSLRFFAFAGIFVCFQSPKEARHHWTPVSIIGTRCWRSPNGRRYFRLRTSPILFAKACRCWGDTAGFHHFWRRWTRFWPGRAETRRLARKSLRERLRTMRRTTC
ncbi:MAG: hypothetical protein WDN03_07585 [Rhizomicrobium sp.]